MGPLQERVMALGKVLEFRHSHDVALDHEGRTVCQTRATVVFSGEPGLGLPWRVAAEILESTRVGDGMSRAGWQAWCDTDDYSRHLVEVHITDVEAAGAACGTEAA